MNAGDPGMVLWGPMGFIFFTWFMWPIWIPFSVYVLEPPDSPLKQLFLTFAAIGTAFGLLLYVPHVINADWVEVSVNQDSLAYEGTMLLDYLMPRWMTYVIYLSLIIAPPLMSRYQHMRYFGGTIIVVVEVDILLLRYAYISFFCLLAGLGTLHLIYIILRNKCVREGYMAIICVCAYLGSGGGWGFIAQVQSASVSRGFGFPSVAISLLLSKSPPDQRQPGKDHRQR
jgi:hypothetical protein